MSRIPDRLRDTVIPAVPVPFGPDGTIDADAQRAYIAWMAGQGVGGVAVWAHTGRGPHLADRQREQILAAWRSGLPDTPIVCGVGMPAGASLPEDPAARHRTAVAVGRESARQASDWGADVLMAHPPRHLGDVSGAADQIVEYHAALAEIGLPVLAFLLYEAAGGVSYDVALLRRILALDGVIGVKVATLDSVMTFQDVARSIADLPDALLISGEDRFLGYSLMCGAHGALVGMAAACTDIIVTLMHAWRTGRYDEFVQLSARIDAFSEATFRVPMEGYVQRMLWALEDDGVIPSAAIDLFGPALDDRDRQRVREAVRALRG